MKYNIEYHRKDGRAFLYLTSATDKPTAERLLKQMRQRYFLPFSNKPKPYPNGEGYYDIINPRIVQV